MMQLKNFIINDWNMKLFYSRNFGILLLAAYSIKYILTLLRET